MMPLDQNTTPLVLSGIHCKTYEPVDVKLPNWALLQSFIDASGGRIRLITLSPEWPGSADFVRQCVEHGLLAAIRATALVWVVCPRKLPVAGWRGAYADQRR